MSCYDKPCRGDSLVDFDKLIFPKPRMGGSQKLTPLPTGQAGLRGYVIGILFSTKVLPLRGFI